MLQQYFYYTCPTVTMWAGSAFTMQAFFFGQFRYEISFIMYGINHTISLISTVFFQWQLLMFLLLYCRLFHINKSLALFTMLKLLQYIQAATSSVIQGCFSLQMFCFCVFPLPIMTGALMVLYKLRNTRITITEKESVILLKGSLRKRICAMRKQCW